MSNSPQVGRKRRSAMSRANSLNATAETSTQGDDTMVMIPENSDSPQKTGAVYFEASRIAELQMDESRNQMSPVERMRARTRSEHPGMNRRRWCRKRALPAPTTTPIFEEDETRQEVIEIASRSQGAGEPLPAPVPNPFRKARLRVEQVDGSDPPPIPTEDLVNLERQEAALSDLLVKRAQWEAQMKEMDDNIGKNLTLLKMSHQGDPTKAPKTKRLSARQTDSGLMMRVTEMNQMLAEEAKRGVPKSELNPGLCKD